MNFSEILTNCRDKNDSIRIEAEKQIDLLSMNNFSGLLLDCAKELADEDKQKQNRQLCATLIKNMLLNQAKHKGKWEELAPEYKNNIKTYILSCLATQDKDVRKACAITVAGKYFF